MFLEKIVLQKKAEIRELKEKADIDQLIDETKRLPAPRDFYHAVSNGSVSIIAEIKKASPSKGELSRNMDVVSQAKIYEDNGAAAISVLTEKYFFKGSIDDLRKVKDAVGLPVLCKDFILDPLQVYESRVAGADAILLIAAILSAQQLEVLSMLASSLGLGVLVEVHNHDELTKVLPLNPKVIGINNRNLITFEVNISNSLMLLPLVPENVCVVSESGIHSKRDISILREAGISAFLIGEALVKSHNPGEKLRSLIN